jgi:predicted dienelactone hydrolase
MRSRFFVLPVLTVALVSAACSNGSDSTDATAGGTAASTPSTSVVATDAPTTAAPTTTVDPATAAMAYTEPGPYPVGVTTLQLPDNGPLVEVWYPAVEGTSGTERYDARDFTPDVLKALLTADVAADFSYAAGRDADVADGAFPLVAFSHGFSGFRLQSTGLTSHLASWGMVVVSSDHPSRDLAHLTDMLSADARPADTSVAELTGAIDLILQENATGGSRFFGTVDDTHIATLGHSAGGGTAYRVALADDRVDGYVSMASGVFLGRGNDSTSTTLEPTTTVAPEYPEKPSFFIAGTEDGIADAEELTRPSFQGAPSPSLLWLIEGAGHLAFSDLCTLGGGLGIIGVAEANGLTAFLDSAPAIRSLGSDGCNPPALPVEDTFPIIDHAVTSWLRSLFGIDASPAGLDTSVSDQYATPVEIQSH